MFIASLAFSQTHIYKLEIMDAAYADVRKEADRALTAIFDVSPIYNELSQTFTVKSDVEISQTDLENKMSNLGFNLISYSRDEIFIKSELENN